MKRVQLTAQGLPDVWVTEEGQIMTLEGKFLTVYPTGQVHVPRGPKLGGRSVNAMKLVASAYLPNPDGWNYVLAEDKDKSNTHPDNLYWAPSYVGTSREEITEELFEQILMLRHQGWGVTEIARKVGFSIYRVSRLVKKYDERIAESQGSQHVSKKELDS